MERVFEELVDNYNNYVYITNDASIYNFLKTIISRDKGLDNTNYLYFYAMTDYLLVTNIVNSNNIHAHDYILNELYCIYSMVVDCMICKLCKDYNIDSPLEYTNYNRYSEVYDLLMSVDGYEAKDMIKIKHILESIVNEYGVELNIPEEGNKNNFAYWLSNINQPDVYGISIDRYLDMIPKLVDVFIIDVILKRFNINII